MSTQFLTTMFSFFKKMPHMDEAVLKEIADKYSFNGVDIRLILQSVHDWIEKDTDVGSRDKKMKFISYVLGWGVKTGRLNVTMMGKKGGKSKFPELTTYLDSQACPIDYDEKTSAGIRTLKAGKVCSASQLQAAFPDQVCFLTCVLPMRSTIGSMDNNFPPEVQHGSGAIWSPKLYGQWQLTWNKMTGSNQNKDGVTAQIARVLKTWSWDEIVAIRRRVAEFIAAAPGSYKANYVAQTKKAIDGDYKFKENTWADEDEINDFSSNDTRVPKVEGGNDQNEDVEIDSDKVKEENKKRSSTLANKKKKAAKKSESFF